MLDTNEQHFDINKVLTDLFMTLKKSGNDKKIELIYDMGIHIPKELRGDSKALLALLKKLLIYVFQNTKEKEIVLSLNAPDDFLYEEDISFKIETTNIGREKILAFLETELGKELKKLKGKIVYDDSDIHLNIPFTINELGFRRHYRLPSSEMLNKKVLLIVESVNVSVSLTKMFNYFTYTVDSNFKISDRVLEKLEKYDLLLIEQKLVTEAFAHKVFEIQGKKSLKCVLFDDIHSAKNRQSQAVSTHLIKPVTQESIFKLLVSLFEYHESDIKETRSSIEKSVDIQYTDTKKLNDSIEDNFNGMIKEKEKDIVLILNKEIGMKNTAKSGLVYAKELRNFVNKFERSDRYFRNIVKDKSTDKIKDFCIDLEKHAKIIGAESMLRFSDIVSLIFVYDKLDMLAIYPGKYHIELDKLLNEIKDHVGR